MKRVNNLLGRAIGLDPAALGTTAIKNVIESRIQVTQVADLDRYVALLEQSPEELAALIEAVVVSETWFFREPAAFHCLGEFLAGARSRLQAERLRVLSIPCATGEEPYSIVIKLLELGLSPASFAVDAVDVSERALAMARRGVYGRNSFRGGRSAPEAFFSLRADGYHVHESVKACVRFNRGNLLDSDLLVGSEFDVVFCRNLLIYLDRSARRTALEKLRRLTAQDGVLFAGHAESQEYMSAGFERFGEPGSFAFLPHRKTVRSAAQVTQPGTLGAPRQVQHRPRVRRTTSDGPLAARSRPTPAPRAHGGATQAARQAAGDELRRARALADRGETAQASALCAEYLLRNAASSEAHCLLGVLNEAAGDLAAARESFEKALYLDPESHESLVHLALLHDRAGSAATAAQLRRRAARCVARRSEQ